MTPWTYYFRWMLFFVAVFIVARLFLVNPILRALERLRW